MKEFEEIAHAGGQITIRPNTGVQEFSHSTPFPVSVFQICVSYDGELLDFVPCLGLGQVPVYPQPSILVYIISDKEGFFGRKCFECKKYFRTQGMGRVGYCAYCGYSGHNTDFTTENQLEYIGSFCNTVIEASDKKTDITIDLDRLIDELQSNKPGWVYTEERQQTQIKCTHCKNKFDILGVYASCPACGWRNSLSVLFEKFSLLEAQFDETRKTITARQSRETVWVEILKNSISDFEGMANDIRLQLLRMPSIPKRKEEIKVLGFFKILKANELLQNWFGFEILDGITEGDRQFLKKMFNRRHVWTHNAGQADQNYIDSTHENSVRVGQIIHIRSKEIARLIPLLKRISQNLFSGYEILFRSLSKN